MSRNGSGTYTLPAGNPVVTGTTIESNWANTTLSDIATTLTDSLSRSGQGGMTAALRLADGTQGAPGLGFANETGSGLYRAGTGEVWAVVQGAQTLNLDATGVTVPADKATSIEGTFVFNETGADKDARFEGDTDANLLFIDASTDRVGVGTNSPSNKLTVSGNADVTGNLGVGTSSPSALIHAKKDQTSATYVMADNNGTINANTSAGFACAEGGSITAFFRALRDGTGEVQLYNVANASFLLGTNNTERVRISAAGNVGIGTNTPTAKLDVSGDASLNGAVIINEAGADKDTRIEGDTDANLVFVDASTDKVGIGTNAPTEKLTVNGGLQATSFNSGQLAGMRNKIINGKMDIAQRGTSFSGIGSANTYGLDRFESANSSAAVYTVTQQADAPSNNEFQNSLRIAITTADASITAGDLMLVRQRIEGYNVRDLIGKTFTLSFWVRSSKTGIHCASFVNSGADRSYVAEYTVNAANTWEYKTVTVSGGLITAGTWNWTNGIGIDVRWALASGSTFQTTAGAWQTGSFFTTSSQVNCLDTIGNIFAITGVQLEVGSVASPFEHRLYGQELALCQRYYQILYWGIRSYAAASAYSYAFTQSYPVAMRVAPTTIATVSAGTLSNCTVTSETAAVRGAYFQVDSSAAGNLSVQNREVSYSSEL